jgi:hypothetical protein
MTPLKHDAGGRDVANRDPIPAEPVTAQSNANSPGMRTQFTPGKASVIEKFRVARYFLESVHELDMHRSNADVTGDAI